MAVGAAFRLIAMGMIVAAALFGAYSNDGVQGDENLDRVARLLRQSKYAQAGAQIDSLILKDPTNIDLYMSVISLCSKHDHHACSVRVGHALLQRNSAGTLARRLSEHELMGVHLVVAEGHWELGQLADAEASYKTALALDPDNPLCLNDLGFFYAEEGMKLHQALRLTKRAARLAPDDGMVVDSLGWAQYKLGRYSEAVETLKRAVRLAPEHAELRYHLAAACVKVGRRDAARVELSKALILDSGQTEAAKLLRTLHN